MLLEMGQNHLFEHWPVPGVDDDEKRELFNQLNFRRRFNVYDVMHDLVRQIEQNSTQLASDGIGHFDPVNLCSTLFEPHIQQLLDLTQVIQGGLASYIKTARELLADSKAGKNPYDGFTPSVPSGEILTFGNDTFIQFEDAGVKEARKAAFVLVAGGLGERLGYNGIKVALPLETTTGTCFLQHYIECILALQETSCRLSQAMLFSPGGSFRKLRK